MLPYNRWYLEGEFNMEKKQEEEFSFEKLIAGRKRPFIALAAGLFVAWGLDNELAGLFAGLVVEGGIMTAIWLIKKYQK